jgi:hypothetical protein
VSAVGSCIVAYIACCFVCACSVVGVSFGYDLMRSAASFLSIAFACSVFFAYFALHSYLSTLSKTPTKSECRDFARCSWKIFQKFGLRLALEILIVVSYALSVVATAKNVIQ